MQGPAPNFTSDSDLYNNKTPRGVWLPLNPPTPTPFPNLVGPKFSPPCRHLFCFCFICEGGHGQGGSGARPRRGVFSRHMGSGPKCTVRLSPDASVQGDPESASPKSVNCLIGPQYPKYSTKRDVLKIRPPPNWEVQPLPGPDLSPHFISANGNASFHL